MAALALVLLSPFLMLGWLVATVSSGGSGIFRQKRVGRDGEVFEVLKLRTMTGGGAGSTVTTSADVRITRAGAWLRRYKLDELPQLINIIRGEMSLVGPRPDVPGFADELQGRDRIILTVRPGITSPASLAYRREEEILASVRDPERYNGDVIWPDKVRMNREYVERYSLRTDVACIARTVATIWDSSPVDLPEGATCQTDS